MTHDELLEIELTPLIKERVMGLGCKITWHWCVSSNDITAGSGFAKKHKTALKRAKEFKAFLEQIEGERK